MKVRGVSSRVSSIAGIAEKFVDDGCSETSFDRSGFQSMLENPQKWDWLCDLQGSVEIWKEAPCRNAGCFLYTQMFQIRVIVKGLAVCYNIFWNFVDWGQKDDYSYWKI